MKKYQIARCPAVYLEKVLNEVSLDGFEIDLSTIKYYFAGDSEMSSFICFKDLPEKPDLEKIADSYNPFYKD